MKFRYKVLLINIILLSIGIGIVGYFMIDHTMNLSMDTQIKTAIDENNLLQSSMEYQILSVIATGSQTSITAKLNELAPSVALGVSANQSDVFLYYADKLLYQNTDSLSSYYPQTLYDAIGMGEKKYLLAKEDSGNYIYVCSCSVIGDNKLCVVNRKDITSVYLQMHQQLQYFFILLLATVLICSILMYLISRLLTKPLETLDRISKAFGKGDYAARAQVNTQDEVGDLAHTYNDMAQAVSEHIEALEDMIQRQDQFIADFTHEIKTPMTSIIGYADTLRSRELSREDQMLSASYIFHEGKRLEMMSRKLFDLIYTKQHEITKSRFWIGSLMDAVAESVEPALFKKHILLRTTYDQAYLDGDVELLRSAFINLIDNARKASEEGSEIRFTGTIEKNRYLIRVIDKGCGISKEHLAHITDAFYMVDKSRSRKEGGAGLGLSLASLIFRCHDAEFSIDSTIGAGTTIQISFALSDQQEGGLE